MACPLSSLTFFVYHYACFYPTAAVRYCETIPSEISLLSNLKFLSLIGKDLPGTVPSELFSLTLLTYLAVGFEPPTIPSEIGLLKNLTFLDWSSSMDTVIILANGSSTSEGYAFPSEIGSLTALTHFHADLFALTGTLPSELGLMTGLSYLDMRTSSMGTIPTELGSLASLAYLNVESSFMTGTLPTELGSLTALTSLVVDVWELTGTIPSELGSLTLLTSLNFGGEIAGTLPTEI